jgi:hypothetical protein
VSISEEEIGKYGKPSICIIGHKNQGEKSVLIIGPSEGMVFHNTGAHIILNYLTVKQRVPVNVKYIFRTSILLRHK